VRIIATTPEESKFLAEIAEFLEPKGIYPSLTNYRDGFGITVWSVDDLDEIPEAEDWTEEERLKFMETYGEKIGGATEDARAKISSYVDEYLEARTA
jgi:hypothetical protein